MITDDEKNTILSQNSELVTLRAEIGHLEDKASRVLYYAMELDNANAKIEKAKEILRMARANGGSCNSLVIAIEALKALSE